MKYYRPLNRNHMKKPVPAWHIILVIGVVIVIILASAASKACDEVYLKIGVGYKLAENNKVTVDGIDYRIDGWASDSARFELGKQQGNISYGISHYSQYSTGWPFNDEKEPARTELFIDYKWSWK